MIHFFDVDIAKEFGINEAVILNNLWYWIYQNKTNNINYYDGHYWTYNSTKAYAQQFPYLSQRQIQNALKKLKEKGIIITGNYNKSAYDRTLWYAFTKKGERIMQNCKMEVTNSEMDSTKGDNPSTENVEPIPNQKLSNINTNIKPNDYNISINQSYTIDFIRAQINYEIFKDRDEIDRINEMVLIIFEVLNTRNETIRISAGDVPTDVAKGIFLKLTYEHIEYILLCMKSVTSEIKNMKAYLTTCLYNSVFAMNNHYDAKVRHDLNY